MVSRVMMGAMVMGPMVMAVALLSGCSTPPWEKARLAAEAAAAEQSPLLTTPSPTSMPSPSSPTPMPAAPLPSRLPTRTPPMVLDELAEGRAQHVIRAGSFVLTTTYWSPRNKDQWKPAGIKPLTFDVTADSRSDLALVAVSVGVERLTLDGWVAIAADQVLQPSVGSGAPAISSPTSASASVSVGAVDAESYALRYTIAYTVTTTGTKTPRVQATGTDSLTVTLTRP